MDIKDEWDVEELLRNKDIDESTIIEQLRNCSDEIRVSGDVFLTAVFWNRFEIAKEMVKFGADVNYKNDGSIYSGNALNVAHSKEQAEWLLEHGAEIEMNTSLHISKPYKNPAIMAAKHNDAIMVLYWLEKENELFGNDEKYIAELFYTVIDVVLMVNQVKTLSVMMRDSKIYGIMKEIYSTVDNLESIKLYQSSLRKIADEDLEAQKKELKKILSARKKLLA